MASALAGAEVKERRACHGRGEAIKRSWLVAIRYLTKAISYEEIGAFWDTRDLTDYWDQTKPVEFEVKFKSQATPIRIESGLSSRIRKLAIQRGAAPETLLYL